MKFGDWIYPPFDFLKLRLWNQKVKQKTRILYAPLSLLFNNVYKMRIRNIIMCNQVENKEKETDLDFKGLDFEQVLEDLLKIKPVENEDLKEKPKKKKQTKSKKK